MSEIGKSLALVAKREHTRRGFVVADLAEIEKSVMVYLATRASDRYSFRFVDEHRLMKPFPMELDEKKFVERAKKLAGEIPVVFHPSVKYDGTRTGRFVSKKSNLTEIDRHPVADCIILLPLTCDDTITTLKSR